MKDYTRFLGELNSEQRIAVETLEGPLLVLAGPGTGKTQLLSVRAGSILTAKNVKPENILILTYTNSAAKAMKERLSRIVGPGGYDMAVGTFHSFANSIIQDSAEAANYIGDRILLNEIESLRAMQFILDNTKGLDEIRPFRAPYTYLTEILRRIGELKKDGIRPRDLIDYLGKEKSLFNLMEDKYIKRLRAFAIAYERYEELKDGKEEAIFDSRGRYDFDDMVIFAAEALKSEAVLRSEYQKQYRYVMVDEYQDTNGAQLDLLFTLLDNKNANILCVGDDDQSIYRFQGANIGNFKILSERFPGIKTLFLKANYRSSRTLLGVSRRIISLIPLGDRMGEKALTAAKSWRDMDVVFKEFTTEEEELQYIVSAVKDMKKVIERDTALTDEEKRCPYNNIAVLVRKRSDILKVIDAFLKAGIPYATDGKEDISGEKRVRQMLDALELACIDPQECGLKDLALFKVLTADYLEIPYAEVLEFVNYVNIKKGKSAGSCVTLLSEFLRCDRERMRHAKDAIGRLIRDARARSVHTLLMNFIKDSGLFKYILKEYADNEILRIRELRALASFINVIKNADISRPAMGLDDFMLEMRTRKDHNMPIQGNLVTLTQTGVRVYTAHGSKGLEFYSVIMPFCLHNKNWPARTPAEKIQLPPDLIQGKEKITDKGALKKLFLQDETRLFYVAATRAKSSLIFTASPDENAVASFYLDSLDVRKDASLNAEEDVIEKSFEVADAKDPLTGTDDILTDMISNLTLNPTRLNTYITCRRKFLFNDILKLPGAKKKSLVFGNCVHKALEDTYKAYIDTKVFPPFNFFGESFKRELKFQGVDKVMEKDCLAKMETVKGWYGRAAKEAVMPIGLEKKLLVTVGDNIIFTGKYDKVEWEDEGKGLIRILDYKTGKAEDHLKNIDILSDPADPSCDGYLRQLVAYKLLFEKDKREAKGRRVSRGILVFIEPLTQDLRRQGYKKGDYVAKSVELTDGMVKKLEETIKIIWADIRKLHFEKLRKRDKKICAMCDFDAICW